MIQIGRIRKGFLYFKNTHTASIEDLFKNLKKTLKKIPNDERWNCYYTLAHHEIGNRIEKTFQSQSVIPFDIDGMNMDKYKEYIPIICEALQIDENKTAIINSGNGLHFLITVETITDVKFFKKYKKAYNSVCKIINKALADADLPGEADSTSFEYARIFRLPGTKNIKQQNNTQTVKECTIISNNFVVQTLDLLKADNVSDKEVMVQGEYGNPDIDYILEECAFLKWIDEAPLEVHEPEWYAMLSITSHFGDDDLTSIRLTDQLDTPSINKSNKEAKITQAVERSGPRKCSSIDLLAHWGKCRQCKHFGKVTSPICLKGPNHISTEKMGFTLKLGNSNIRQYIDMLKFYDKTYHHKSVSDMGRVYIYDDNHYRVTNKPEIRNFALEYFKPTAKATERAEFSSYVEDSFIESEKFMNNKNNEGLINFKNGVLDVDSGELLDHDPDYQFFYCLPFNYDPKAKAPTWTKYIQSITLARPCLQNILHEYMGYIIRGGDYIYHKALILSGSGKNGKSTFIEVIRALIGDSNCSDTSITAISADKFMVAELHGKLVNFSEEEPPECFKQTGKFKHITGNSKTIAQFKYGQPFNMKNKAKMVISYNEVPYLSDTSIGMKRRLMIVPFDFDLEKQSKKLDINIQQKLLKELPGIFNIAFEGWKRLQKQKGFTKSKFVDDELDELIGSSDPYSAWLKDEVHIKEKRKVPITEFYNSYTKYTYQNYNSKPMSRRRFSVVLKRSFFELFITSINGSSVRCVKGVELIQGDTVNPGKTRF